MFGEGVGDGDRVILLPLLEERPFVGSFFFFEFIFGVVALCIMLFILLPLVLAIDGG